MTDQSQCDRYVIFWAEIQELSEDMMKLCRTGDQSYNRKAFMTVAEMSSDQLRAFSISRLSFRVIEVDVSPPVGVAPR